MVPVSLVYRLAAKAQLVSDPTASTLRRARRNWRQYQSMEKVGWQPCLLLGMAIAEADIHCYPALQSQTMILEQIAKKIEEIIPSVISLTPNGDPYGGGFTATQSEDMGQTWYYRGDVGAMSRQWWRSYCNKHGHVLRYDE